MFTRTTRLAFIAIATAAVIGLLYWGILAVMDDIAYSESPEGQAAAQASHEAKIERLVTGVVEGAISIQGMNAIFLPAAENCSTRFPIPMKSELEVRGRAFQRLVPNGTVTSIDPLYSGGCHIGTTIIYRVE